MPIPVHVQDSWLSAKADEIQGHADRKDSKRFYEGLETVYGVRYSGRSTSGLRWNYPLALHG